MPDRGIIFPAALRNTRGRGLLAAFLVLGMAGLGVSAAPPAKKEDPGSAPAKKAADRPGKAKPPDKPQAPGPARGPVSADDDVDDDPASPAFKKISPANGAATPAAAVEPPGPRQGDKAEPLSAKLKAIVDGAGGRTGEWGVKALSLSRGEVLFAHRAGEPMNPASNLKLVSSAAALTALGPDFQFSTGLYTGTTPVNGVIDGDLFVFGDGDPSLVSERLWFLAGQIRSLGIRRIEGDIIVDDSWFAPPHDNPAWKKDSMSSQSYTAPYGALSLNYNAVAITVLPGEKDGAKPIVTVDPEIPYLPVKNTARTISKGRSRLRLETQPLGDKTQVVVAGTLRIDSEGRKAYRKIFHPPLFTGWGIHEYLKLRGVTVKGKVKTAVFDRNRMFELYTFRSEPLAVILRPINKVSSNFTAEQVLKALGAKIKGSPGTWKGGLSAVEDFLEKAGLPRGSYIMTNGSGLSEDSRFSADQLVRVLEYMFRQPVLFPEYASSLSIAGADGTLRSRMTRLDPPWRVRGKTGSLDNVASLSGYIQTAGGDWVAFSAMINNHRLAYRQATGLLDRIAEAIAGDTTPPAPGFLGKPGPRPPPAKVK
ncbi:MAG: hypothetical protein GMKNLPBB_00542 [Myxococcota bacterium]|nr:hypothetical protein [Myxococcota bacterium]